jgi:hypothetical protein
MKKVPVPRLLNQLSLKKTSMVTVYKILDIFAQEAAHSEDKSRLMWTYQDEFKINSPIMNGQRIYNQGVRRVCLDII